MHRSARTGWRAPSRSHGNSQRQLPLGPKPARTDFMSKECLARLNDLVWVMALTEQTLRSGHRLQRKYVLGTFCERFSKKCGHAGLSAKILHNLLSLRSRSLRPSANRRVLHRLWRRVATVNSTFGEVARRY